MKNYIIKICGEFKKIILNNIRKVIGLNLKSAICLVGDYQLLKENFKYFFTNIDCEQSFPLPITDQFWNIY